MVPISSVFVFNVRLYHLSYATKLTVDIEQNMIPRFAFYYK